MITLHFGVIDIPYEEGKATTGDVAEILEAKYKIMQTFFDSHQQEIADFLAKDMALQIETLMAGGPVSPEPLAEAMGNIKLSFSRFLEAQEMDGSKGVPTRRALLGITKRFKSRRGEPRPSFIDTGDYQRSFIAWVSGLVNDVDF